MINQLKKQQLKQLKNQDNKQSKYRFINFFLFLGIGLMNGFPAQAFTIISVQVSKIYNINKTLINLNSLIFNIIHLPATFFANYVLEQHGLRIGIVVGSIFIIIGVLIKLLINLSFYFCLIGSILAAIGSIFILNSPMKLAINWFREDKVSIINTFCVITLMTSSPIGSFIPALFVDDKQHNSKNNIMNLLLFQGIIISSFELLAILFIRNKPKCHPNLRSKFKRQKYLPSLKKLIKNKNYIKLFISMAIMFGTLTCYFINLQWQIKPYGFTSVFYNYQKQIGYMTIVSNISGFIGSIFISSVIRKYVKNLKKFTVILLIFGSLGFIISLVLLQTQNFYFLLISSATSGFFIYPSIPYLLQLGSYIAFPVGQASATGFLFAGGQSLGFLMGISFIQLYDGKSKNRSRIGSAIIVLLLIISLISICLVKNEKILQQDLIKQSQQLFIQNENQDNQIIEK